MSSFYIEMRENYFLVPEALAACRVKRRLSTSDIGVHLSLGAKNLRFTRRGDGFLLHAL